MIFKAIAKNLGKKALKGAKKMMTPSISGMKKLASTKTSSINKIGLKKPDYAGKLSTIKKRSSGSSYQARQREEVLKGSKSVYGMENTIMRQQKAKKMTGKSNFPNLYSSTKKTKNVDAMMKMQNLTTGAKGAFRSGGSDIMKSVKQGKALNLKSEIAKKGPGRGKVLKHKNYVNNLFNKSSLGSKGKLGKDISSFKVKK